ncbi:hypothetical protein Pmani_024048 [Petrolisthes manimaculis]|uniref:Uncharacterized protein n=1 Tax=Petrolisthes manimaculis TaxID=1843537 RepID=A0AAE1P9I6_9EUCA|nr:hypothetical protein Pmani_024048 [Petrolisthes manimaculis]
MGVTGENANVGTCKPGWRGRDDEAAAATGGRRRSISEVNEAGLSQDSRTGLVGEAGRQGGRQAGVCQEERQECKAGV